MLKRYNRETYIRVQGDVLDGLQPPDIHAQVFPLLEPIKAKLPPGYRIDTAGSVEESAKAMTALVKVFPIMLIVTLTVIMLQVRSFSTMFMVFATARRWVSSAPRPPCWSSTSPSASTRSSA